MLGMQWIGTLPRCVTHCHIPASVHWSFVPCHNNHAMSQMTAKRDQHFLCSLYWPRLMYSCGDSFDLKNLQLSNLWPTESPWKQPGILVLAMALWLLATVGATGEKKHHKTTQIQLFRRMMLWDHGPPCRSLSSHHPPMWLWPLNNYRLTTSKCVSHMKIGSNPIWSIVSCYSSSKTWRTSHQSCFFPAF